MSSSNQVREIYLICDSILSTALEYVSACCRALTQRLESWRFESIIVVLHYSAIYAKYPYHQDAYAYIFHAMIFKIYTCEDTGSRVWVSEIDIWKEYISVWLWKDKTLNENQAAIRKNLIVQKKSNLIIDWKMIKRDQWLHNVYETERNELIGLQTLNFSRNKIQIRKLFVAWTFLSML